MRTQRTLQFLALVLVARVPVVAVICSVPGTYPTIQEAVDDLACTQVDLADQTYAESVLIPRSLTVAGTGASIIEGRVLALGLGTQLDLVDLTIQNGCSPEALEVERGAQAQGTNLTVVRSGALPCPAFAGLFADGFESGDTSAWSTTVP